jgi:Xaa-Pro aminopeptidase
MRAELTLAFFITFCFTTFCQNPLPGILPERDRARIVDEILEDRIDNLLPQLMRREGIDMWVLISREYNEDPVMKTILPSTWLSARRRTMMAFYDPGEGKPIEKIAIARYDVGKLLKGTWDLDVYPEQWEALKSTIEQRNPKKIGLNTSENFGLADGLPHTEYLEFMKHLPKKYHGRVVSAENLAVAWLETRTERELELYPMICRLGHTILQEGLSEMAIHPGITTTDDVVWWLRQRVTDLGLDTWFQPSVSIQRADRGNQEFLRSFSKRPEDDIIRPGDLLHVDFGITYLRLNTDQQQHFYVLKPGETEVPEGLKKAFKNGNRLQDILIENFEEGRSGNEILAAALKQAAAEGIQASIYTHPIGLHGHAAGPTIGLWDQQQGVKGRGGDYPLFSNTAYSIELFAASEVPEWGGKIVRIMLEEDGVFQNGKFWFLDGRQEEILTIPRHAGN